MKNIVFILLLSLFYKGVLAQRPLISHIYAADPSAHVWPNDHNTLWLYTSHDVSGTNHHITMFDYHVFSTTDLVNWVDHGRVLSVDNVSWAGTHAWAIDAVYRNEKYHLVYCMIETATGLFRTGIAVSDFPQGPFTDKGFVKNVVQGQDPAVFVDDDNRAYLFWGAGGNCFAAELNDDLMSIKPETLRDLKGELIDVYEGPWVHKYNEKYYLSYPGLPNEQWPQEMYYATADYPLGPYTSKGKYIPKFKGHSGTNHGSIVNFKGQWIAFYHASILSGGNSYVRNLMADFLYYNNDGTIKTIVPGKKGITNGIRTNSVIKLEAENGKSSGGELSGTYVSNISEDFSGSGYVTGFDVGYKSVTVLAQVAKDMKANLKIKLSAETDFNADVIVGAIALAGWDGLSVSKTEGWELVDFGQIDLKAGDNLIRFGGKGNVKLKVDYFLITPVLK